MGHLGVACYREGEEVVTFIAQKPDFGAVEATKVAKVVALRYDPS